LVLYKEPAVIIATAVKWVNRSSMSDRANCPTNELTINAPRVCLCTRVFFTQFIVSRDTADRQQIILTRNHGLRNI